MTESIPNPEPALPSGGQAPSELRFFLPPGPPLSPKRWQRRWKIGIRVGSAVAAVVLIAFAALAIGSGVVSSSRYTATGAVEVDCTTRNMPRLPAVGFGSLVQIFDAQSGERYGQSTLDRFRALPSGICLAGFEIRDVRVASLYTVEIGRLYRTLVSEEALKDGALLS
ncbi:hypothetical protein ACE11G_07365 [Gordonia sp. PS3]|uniref:hypothetical protein n=1 Tax=Gordonia TaxID=2053 RepID=UPI0005ED6E53|nr:MULTISPECIES: hypothetical protein [Gordonia]KJR07082.1 hypothetical protein UG54_11770 [Gordonia sihwensis]KXT56266.1 hypothetical protein Y710_14455 [Gordonia sp. QH-12]MBY4570555.1 hypothetical protein [Gordonia sihwensis]WFN91307.1 hypothetical protein P5P27_10950 [Gordonia sihwensis]